MLRRSHRRWLARGVQERQAGATWFGTPSTFFHEAFKQRHIGTPRFDRQRPQSERPQTFWYIIYISNIRASIQELWRSGKYPRPGNRLRHEGKRLFQAERVSSASCSFKDTLCL